MLILVVKKRHSLPTTQAAHKYPHLGLSWRGEDFSMLAEQSTFKKPPSQDAIGDVFGVQHIHQKNFFVHIILMLSTIVHVSEMPLVENGIRDVLLNKSKVINLTGALRPAQHRHTPSNI